jgi:hypothetical protein
MAEPRAQSLRRVTTLGPNDLIIATVDIYGRPDEVAISVADLATVLGGDLGGGDTGGGFLLEDGSSFLLLEDGASQLILE